MPYSFVFNPTTAELDMVFIPSGGGGTTDSSLALDVVCDPTVAVGDWVRIDVTGTAVQALADVFDNAHVLGVVENKGTGTTCDVRCAGFSAQIFTSLTFTGEYFLSWTTPGAMTTTVPPEGVVTKPLGRALTDQIFSVNLNARIQG